MKKWRRIAVGPWSWAALLLILVILATIVAIPVLRHGVWTELGKLNPEAILIGLSLLGSALVGTRISAAWNVRQKRKELDLATARDFHDIYGEFFAIWKTWRFVIQNQSAGTGDLANLDRATLLVRVCDVEGRLESIFVRLSCERVLDVADVECLGRFRQLFQQLREAIFSSRELNWFSSEHPEYAAFKRLAVRVAMLIDDDRARPTPDAAEGSLRRITSNKWEQHVGGNYKNY